MPDTAIFAALSGLVEEGEVDTEGFKEWLVRVEAKIDKIRDDSHAVDRRLVKAESDLNGLGMRIDSVRIEVRDVEARIDGAEGPGARGWAAIIIAAITAIGSGVVAYLTRGGK